MRKIPIYWILLSAFLLASCGTVPPAATASPTDQAAETPPENPFIPYGVNVRFEHIGLDEGLSQSVINTILQDRKGFLWFGTDDGLNRYDGYNFTVYKPETSDLFSLTDRTITAMVEDPDGILWIGTLQGGLNRFDPSTGKFTHFIYNKNDDQSVAGNHITALCLDKNGLWIGTTNGLDFYNFSSGTFTHYRDDSKSPVRLSSKSITTLMVDSYERVWIGTSDAGLNIYDQESNKLSIYKYNKYLPTSLSSNRVLSMVEQEGKIWIGTANGLSRYDSAGNVFIRFRNSREDAYSIAGDTIDSLYVDRSGGLWVGTNEGLDRYDAQNNKFIHHQNQPTVPNSLSNNQVKSIYEDQSGVIWVGTYGGGLNKYNRQQDRFIYFRNNPNDPHSLSSNLIFAILADPRGYIWVGTFDNGLNRYDPFTETFTQFKHDLDVPSTISSDDVIALYIDKKGTLWAGTSAALDRYDPTTKSFIHYKPDDHGDEETSQFSVFAIKEDKHGNFWVGSNRGLWLFNTDTGAFTQYRSNGADPNALSRNRISVIYEDKDHNLWIGTTDEGLKRIEAQTGKVTSFQYDPEDDTSLGSNLVLCIYQDKTGTLWIGTHGGGLNRYDPETGSFTRFTENEGLPNNVIYGILEDESGNFWMSTNFGLSRFDPVNLTFRNFTANDGLQSNEFDQNAFAKDKYGNMYFGGVNGLNIFKPREIIDNPRPPKVALTSFTLDGTPLVSDQTPEYLKTITLQWPQDSFEFEFASLAFEQPSRNQYSYMLDGFDPNWINIGTRRNGRYTNLPGGTYTLRLRGSNSDGTWSEVDPAIQIVVVPPFWETWWFGSLCIVLFGLVVAGGLRWRVKSVESRNRELERIVRKSTADLEKRNREIEALYQADEKILRSVTLNHISQTLVDVSVSLLNADRSVVFTWNEKKQKVGPYVSRGFQQETLSVMQFDEGEGLVGLAIKSGVPVIIADISSSDLRSDVKTVMEKEGIKSFAHFPIMVDGKVVAVFNVAYTRPNALTKDSIRLFTSLVNRASLSIANMELFEQTKDLAVMEERNRLARDLHDSAKQKAFAALAQLGTVNGMVRMVPQEVAPHLSEAETLVYEVIQELNFLIQEIYPIALQEKGLQTTLREYIFQWESRNDTVVHLSIQNERPLSLDMEQAVYRVIQEALANISRHSRAKRADISLVYNSDLLQVFIADDGCGFDVNQKAKGLGFRSMRERISSIRGTLQLQSAPGQGTRIMIQIPIKGNGGD